MNLALYSGGAFGLVNIGNPDGSLNRQFRITQAQYDALGLVDALAPLGCTEAEWRNPGTRATGGHMAIGDIQTADKGSLIVKYAEGTNTDGTLIEKLLVLNAADYTGIAPNITAQPAALASVKGTPVASITSGVLTPSAVTVG